MSVSTLGRHRAARGLSTAAAITAAALLVGLTSASTRAASFPDPSSVEVGPAPRLVRQVSMPTPSRLSTRVRRAITTAASQKKAVIVVGPVGSNTNKFIGKANAVADAAQAWGMEVVKIYPPNATWNRVVDEANGADLFVYVGHGNGWPSPYPPFQEDTKDGLGLNPTMGDTNTYRVKYWGANHIREDITFAPNAIVLLLGLCYAAGNAEPRMPIPTTDVAHQRVDNYASGFLAKGAKVVFALGWQPGDTIVNSLFGTTPKTMDGIFQTSFGSNRDGSYKPYFGWIGWEPNLYFDSVRTPGAQSHLDPDPEEGFLRALSGELELTTEEWLGNVDLDDTEPPVVSDLAGQQAGNTIPAGVKSVPVFTPNGDGLSDTLKVKTTVSEGSFLNVQIRKPDDTLVRRFTTWAPEGPGSFSWDGRNDSGNKVADGRYDIVVTPRDRSGNVGEAVRVAVKVLTAIKAPTVAPELFYAADGDLLAQTTKLGVTLTKDASVTWRITTKAGAVVRHGMVDQALPAGSASFDWDGQDDSGAMVPDGVYQSVVTATTAQGTYSHKVAVRPMPFWLKGDLTVNAGQAQTLTLLTAEPVDGWPRIEVKQPGLDWYRLYPMRYSTTKFTARWTAKAGATGTVTIKVTATDSGGGVEVRKFTGELQ